MIKQIFDGDDKKRITRQVLEALPDWFGIPEAREDYIKNSVEQIFFTATEQEREVGFIYLKETGKETVELYVMGVLKEYHRRGIGRELFKAAKACAADKGYSFMQVKTVQMGKYKEYDDTNRFYINMGFKEFEVFHALWDEQNPCQVYVMALK